jgi:RNA polymerase sigma-70 factor, ECF subfamily
VTSDEAQDETNRAPRDPSSETDALLVSAAQGGNQEAFRKLFERYFRLVSVMIYQKVPAAADVEDLTQETFLRAWRGLPALRTPTRFMPWLMKIARRLIADWHRRAVREPGFVHQPLEAVAHTDDSGRQLAAAEDHRRLLQALDQLPERYRLVLTFRFLEGLAPQDIARRLGEPGGTIRNRIFRGLEKLAALMEQSREGRDVV